MEPLLDIPTLSAVELAALSAADRAAREAKLLAAIPIMRLFLAAPKELHAELSAPMQEFVRNLEQMWKGSSVPSEAEQFLADLSKKWS